MPPSPFSAFSPRLCRALFPLMLITPAWTGVAAAEPRADELIRQWQANPTARQSALQAGKQAAAFCVNCHGEDGNTREKEVPNLAGQNPVFLVEQMRKFAVGERKNAFMEGMIKIMSEADRARIALYYSTANILPGPPASPAQTKLAQGAYQRYCARCHGDDGQGNELNPRVAGQRLDYLKQSMARYRQQSGERVYTPMTGAVRQMSEEETAAVAAYLAGTATVAPSP